MSVIYSAVMFKLLLQGNKNILFPSLGLLSRTGICFCERTLQGRVRGALPWQPVQKFWTPKKIKSLVWIQTEATTPLTWSCESQSCADRQFLRRDFLRTLRRSWRRQDLGLDWESVLLLFKGFYKVNLCKQVLCFSIIIFLNSLKKWLLLDFFTLYFYNSMYNYKIYNYMYKTVYFMNCILKHCVFWSWMFL